MRGLTFVFALLAGAAAIPDFGKVELSDAQFQRHLLRPQVATVVGQCINEPFMKAQEQFNIQIGYPPEVTWRQSNSLNRFVNNLIINNGSDGLALVCAARSNFVSTLAATYPWCVNRFYLLGQGDTTFDNVIYYVHLYKHLEFICSAAFDTYSSQNVCIKGVQASSDYNNCYKAFNNANKQNPNAFCGNTASLTTCMQGIYTKACGVKTGWMECELERVGFAYDCPSIVCTLPPN